jgi:hypothetical protein
MVRSTIARIHLINLIMRQIPKLSASCPYAFIRVTQFPPIVVIFQNIGYNIYVLSAWHNFEKLLSYTIMLHFISLQ